MQSYSKGDLKAARKETYQKMTVLRLPLHVNKIGSLTLTNNGTDYLKFAYYLYFVRRSF